MDIGISSYELPKKPALCPFFFWVVFLSLIYHNYFYTVDINFYELDALQIYSLGLCPVFCIYI